MQEIPDHLSTQFPAPSATAGRIARIAATAVLVAGVAFVFVLAGGWLMPQALTPARIIDTFEQVDGPHPGFRRNHAKGVGVSGYFDSTGQGVAFSRASVFKPGRVPVIGRFALAGGDPNQPDAPRTTRSMALLFKMPDGQEWRTGMNNIPVFPVATVQAFQDQLVASAPDPNTGKPDPAKMKSFLLANPESAKAIQLIRAGAISSGFDNSTFNSLDAFRFINSDGQTTFVRWSVAPVQPFVPISTTMPAQTDKNYLFDELIASIHRQPLQWHLMIVIGQKDDPTNDATLPWPSDRRQIDAGTLTIDSVESEETSPARDINFDPLVLPDGIAGSDDPLLSARSAAYSQSFTRREGEKKDPSAVSAVEVGK